VAVRAASLYLCRSLRNGRTPGIDILRDAVTAATRMVRALGPALTRFGIPYEPIDLACTLVIAVVVAGRLYHVQVGDGAVVISGGGEIWCLTPPPEREYLNETAFLVSPDAGQRLHLMEHDASAIETVAVMTDGVQYLGLDPRTHAVFRGMFDPILKYAIENRHKSESERDADLCDFLSSAKVNAETDDDKTLIIAVRRPEVQV
jgi:hypothetical protein